MTDTPRVPYALLVEEPVGGNTGTPQAVFLDTTDGFDILPSLIEDYVRRGWAVRCEGLAEFLEDGWEVSWHFPLEAIYPGINDGIGRKPGLGPPTWVTYDGDAVALEYVRDDYGRGDQVIPVFRIYEYDANNLIHAVLAAEATEYVPDEKLYVGRALS